MDAPADATAARDRPRWWTRFRRRARADDRAPGDVACRNCGTDAPGAYCPACGQETSLRLPTAGQFMRDAAGRYVAFDGRMWRTLAPLLVRPGFLTREYLAGRRRRYVRPARLVLVLAIVMFAVVRFAADPVSMIDLRDAPAEVESPAASAPSASKAPAPAAPAPAPSAVPPGDGKDRTLSLNVGPSDRAPPADAKDKVLSLGFAPADRAALRTKVIEGDTAASALVAYGLEIDDNLNLRWRGVDSPFGQAVDRRLEAFNRLDRTAKVEAIAGGMLRYGPYALIGLLPAFALLMQVVYLLPRTGPAGRPRRYSEHLVYAAHNHAFLALAGTLFALAPWVWASFALVAWGALYLPLSMRRVYGGGRIGIAARSLVVTVVYSALFGVGVIALVVAAIVLR